MSASREFLLDLSRRFEPEAVASAVAEVTREAARELLAHEAERDAAEFSFDAMTGTVRFFGSTFSSALLRNFRTSSHEDECYQHVRREDGVIAITRTYGHRRQMRDLRVMLESRPRVADQDRLNRFNADVEILLATPPDVFMHEAVALDNLVLRAREFRDAAQRLGVEASDEAREAQLIAFGVLLEAIHRVDFTRERLFTRDELAAPASAQGPTA